MKLSQRGPAIAQQQRSPNIVFKMGDDIGWSNIRERVRCSFPEICAMT
jgi:hypothetical protein